MSKLEKEIIQSKVWENNFLKTRKNGVGERKEGMERVMAKQFKKNEEHEIM